MYVYTLRCSNILIFGTSIELLLSLSNYGLYFFHWRKIEKNVKKLINTLLTDEKLKNLRPGFGIFTIAHNNRYEDRTNNYMDTINKKDLSNSPRIFIRKFGLLTSVLIKSRSIEVRFVLCIFENSLLWKLKI